MSDYELMYAKMFNATQDAIKILMDAQLACEAMFMEQGDNEETAIETT